MLPEFTADEYSAVLDRVAAEMLQRAEIDAPPVNALTVARAWHVVVAIDDRQANRARFLRSAGGEAAGTGSILLRSEPRLERRQWAVMHELGEMAAQRVFEALGVRPAEAPAGMRETVANQLAGRLLLPRAWFERDGRACGWDLTTLKGIYATASHELIARRMLELAPPVIVTVRDAGRITWRRSNLPGRVPPWSAGEESLAERLHLGLETACEEAGPPRVQGWAIHEPHWKREIVRLEIDD